MSWPDSPNGGLLGDGRYASATDRPETVDALREIVQSRVAEGHALYPQGGGTSLDYGGPPRSPGVALDTRSLNRVIDYPAADMTITVEAGITMAALQALLAEQNQRLLVDAPLADRATIGAVFATNTSGPRRLGAGRPRDQIIGVSFVTADGALVKGGGRVVKNVAGYDFPRLLTGSLGTLGIITQLTLKVRPRPEATAIVWVPMTSLDAAGEALDRLNTSGTRPMALELLNQSPDQWTLAVGFEDNALSVAWQVDRLIEELDGPKVETFRGADAEPLWTGLTESQAAELGPVSFVANLRPSAVIGFIHSLPPERWSIQAHAGNGIVRGHLLHDPGFGSLAPEIDRMRAEAVHGGGNLILSRCPAEWKERLRVWGEPRPDWAIAERIKKAFDPRGVMNPGRFVGKI